MIKCFAAESSFWIDPQGHVRPCGRYKEKMQHISNFDDWSKVTDSSEYRALREDLNNGVWHSPCYRCKEDEEKGLKSKRTFYDRIGLEANVDFMIDISMGNFCNLKCRMCGPHNSTLWKTDFDFLVQHKLHDPSSIDTTAYMLSSEDLKKLKNHVSNIRGNVLIELKGGEPLIMPQTEELIKEFLELDNINKISLLIVTNGTYVPDWLEAAASKFKEIFLAVSVDGFGDVYNYIRGTKSHNFDVCFENIKKFSKIKNIKLRFNVVVQNLNVHQILDLHKILIEFEDVHITYITLSGPSYYRLNVLPEKFRHELYSKFLERKEEFGSYQSQMESIYKILLNTPDDKLVNKFKNISKALDLRRDQKLLDVLPHMIDL